MEIERNVMNHRYILLVVISENSEASSETFLVTKLTKNSVRKENCTMNKKNLWVEAIFVSFLRIVGVQLHDSNKSNLQTPILTATRLFMDREIYKFLF